MPQGRSTWDGLGSGEGAPEEPPDTVDPGLFASGGAPAGATAPLRAPDATAPLPAARARPAGRPAGPPALGRYDLAEELGRGGMGVVYRAWDRQLDREVALKVLTLGPAAFGQARDRFLKEARAMARLRHPNIIEVWDIGEDDHAAWFAMRCLRDGSLAARITREGRLKAPEALRLTAELADALEHAHRAGLIHRDVKPANVLLDGDRPVLTDFGLVKDLGPEASALTHTNALLGTPAYMAPEVVEEGVSAASPRSDLYALGVLLYEALCGERPFRGGSQTELLRRITHEPPRPLEDWGVAPEVARLCRRAMAHDPAQRFEDAAALAAACRAVAAGQDAVSRREDWRRRAGEAAARLARPLALFGASAVVGGLLLAAGDALWRASETRARERLAEERRVGMEAQAAARRAAGDPEEADALFSAFTEHPDHAETSALATAWLAEGARRFSTGALDAAVDAYATAWATSRQPADQVEALVMLCQIFHRKDDWDRLEAALATLAEAAPDALAEDRLAAARLNLAGARRDLAAAAALAPPALAPLVRALSRVTTTAHTAREALRWDADGDGVEELALVDAGSAALTLTRLAPDLPLLRAVALPPSVAPGLAAVPLAEGAALGVTWDSGPALLTLGPTGLQQAATWPGRALWAPVRLDLDLDGQPEIVYSGLRTLYTARRRADGSWETAVVPGSTSNANSDLSDLMVLPWQGQPALFVAAGVWGAYDVRVLTPAPGGPTRAARIRLGDVVGLAPVRAGGEVLIAALQRHDPDQLLDIRAFGLTPPHGRALGLHLLRAAGDTLTSAAVLPLPTPPAEPDPSPTLRFTPLSPRDLLVGDLDRDGEDEIVVGVGGHSFVFHRAPDGRWERLSLGALHPLLATDLDGDGDDELVVAAPRDGMRVLVLGAGDEALPALAARTAPRGDPPAGLPRDVADRWARAEGLVALGLTEQAAERFQRIAQLAGDDEITAAARLRAADLLASIGRSEAAAALYARAASVQSAAAAGWEGAWRSFRAALKLEQARDAARRRVAIGGAPAALGADLRALEGLLVDDAWTLDFGAGFREELRVLAPHRVAWEAARGGLRVVATGGQPAVVVPVRRTAGRMRIAVRLTPRRVEWGSRLGVAFGREGDPDSAVGAELRGGGGGGRYSAAAACLGGGDAARLDSLDFSEVVGQELELVWEYAPGDGRARCELHRPGGAVQEVVYALAEPPYEGEDAALFIGLSLQEHAATEAILRSVTVRGFQRRSEALTEAEWAELLVVRGEPEAALARLGASGSWLTRGAALLRLGRVEEAAQLFRGVWTREPEARDRLAELLLADPDGARAALQRALGAAYVGLARTALGTSALSHYEDPNIGAVILSGLAGIEDLAPPPAASASELLAFAEMAMVHGTLLRRQGQGPRARGELDRAWALLAALPEPHAQSAEVARFRAHILREQAAQALSRGDPDRALEHLQAALAAHPAPEVLADRLSVDPELAPLRDRPGWAAITAARGLGPTAP